MRRSPPCIGVVVQTGIDVLDRDLQIVGGLLNGVAVLPDGRDDLRDIQSRAEQRRPATRLAVAEVDQRVLVAAHPLLDVALRQCGLRGMGLTRALLQARHRTAVEAERDALLCGGDGH